MRHAISKQVHGDRSNDDALLSKSRLELRPVGFPPTFIDETVFEEKVGGLTRLARAYAQALQPLDLWLERDLSNSSVERVAVPLRDILTRGEGELDVATAFDAKLFDDALDSLLVALPTGDQLEVATIVRLGLVGVL